MKRRDFVTVLGLAPLVAKANTPCPPVLTAIDDSSVATSTTCTAVNGVGWPAQTPSYLPIIPNISGFGANQYGGSGRHSRNQTYVLFVDRLATNEVGGSTPGSTNGSLDTTNRVGYGSLTWCLNRAVPRTIIPLVSGLANFRMLSFIASNPYLTFAGQCAPSPGLYTLDLQLISGKGLAPNYTKHHVWWHLGSFMGATSWSAANGDNFRNTGNYTVFANCSGMWSQDETFDLGASNSSDGAAFTTCWQCLAAEGMGESKDGNGRGILADNYSDFVDVIRCAMIHSMQRNPMLRAAHSMAANNLVYNWNSSAGEYSNKSGVASSNNIEQTLYLYHPSNSPIRSAIHRTNSGDYRWDPTNSRMYVNKARQLRWEANSIDMGGSLRSEADLFESGYNLVEDPLERSRLTASYPDGLQLYDLGTIGANDGKREEFAKLLLNDCGPRPKDRLPAIERVIRQTNNRIANNGGDYGNPPKSLSAVGSLIPSVSQRSISDPFSRQSEWGNRSVHTLAENREAPYASGTFSDGTRRAGYTRLEEYLNELHLQRNQ
jgi:hypothetical protein